MDVYLHTNIPKEDFNNLLMLLLSGAMWIDWRADGNLLACAGCGELYIYDLRTNGAIKCLKNLHIGMT